ncbi:hypothetical protein TNCV_2676111 [Trichonephila clavipes]|nr:hypothetical protein TNCV_2676111 [Trichonephila clavipes]
MTVIYILKDSISIHFAYTRPGVSYTRPVIPRPLLPKVMHNCDGLSIGRIGWEPGRSRISWTPNKFSGYKFRSASAKGACRSASSKNRNELKSALIHNGYTRTMTLRNIVKKRIHLF